MSSQITAKVPAVTTPKLEDLQVLRLSVKNNPLLRAFKTSSCRVLRPYTVTSEEVAIAMADNLFDYVVRGFWSSKFLLGALSELPVTTPRRISESNARFPKPKDEGKVNKI